MNDITKACCIVGGVIGCLVLLASCNSCRQDIKRIKSNTTGLRRTVTLFDAHGKPIKAWNTTSTYNDNGGSVTFLDENEKFVGISGTFIIEEK